MSRASDIINRAVSRRQFMTGMGAGALVAAVLRERKASAAFWPYARGGGLSPAFNGYYPSGHYNASPPFPFNTSNPVANVIYPRPDSETNTWARHRWMFYDGVNAFTNIIPILVRGGSFPYVFQIISAPAGTTMGASVWQPNWTAADALAAGYGDLEVAPTGTFSGATFQIRVFDQTGAYVDVVFTASTIAGYNATAGEGFVFLDPVIGTDPTSYPSSGTSNNFSTPIKTPAWAWGVSSTSVTYPNAILVQKGGTSAAYAQTGSGSIQPNPGYSPMAFIGQPGVTSTVDLTNAGTSNAFYIGSGAHDLFVQGFTMTGGPSASNYFRTFAAGYLTNRTTLHNISLPNVFTGTAPTANNNCGPFYLNDPDSGSATTRQYVALKGVSQTNSANPGNAVYNFSLLTSYKVQYLLVDLCSATNSGASGMTVKASCSDVTIREVLVQVASSGAFPLDFYDQWNTAPCNNREICFSTFDISAAPSGYASAVQINGSFSAGVPTGTQAFGTTASYRNNYVGCPFDVNAPSTPVTNGPVSSVNDAIQWGSASQAIYIGQKAATLPSNVTNTGTDSQAATGIFTDPATGDYSLVNSARNGLDGANIA